MEHKSVLFSWAPRDILSEKYTCNSLSITPRLLPLSLNIFFQFLFSSFLSFSAGSVTFFYSSFALSLFSLLSFMSFCFLSSFTLIDLASIHRTQNTAPGRFSTLVSYGFFAPFSSLQYIIVGLIFSKAGIVVCICRTEDKRHGAWRTC